MASESFDCVVVGAGSAGAVIAARLSEDPGTTVLLLEAGPAADADEITIPAAFAGLFKTRWDWNYQTSEQKQLHSRRTYWPRMKALARHVDHACMPVGSDPSEAEIVEHVRAHTQTLYHPVGTCVMGAGDRSVVDPELRVHGIEGLRVGDASVMPQVPRGNTNAPTIMVGEMAADLLRARTATTGARA